MNFAKRAISSVTRRKGKSIILFAVIFILGNVIAGAISTQQATENVEKNIKSQLGGKAMISFDDTAYQKDNKNGQNMVETAMPTIKDIKKIGELSYVKYYDYNAFDYAGTNKLISYSPPKTNEEFSGFSGGFGTKYQFNFYGVNYPKVLDIQEKKIELVDGRVFTQEEVDKGSSVAIISKNVAEANNLHVGDNLVVDETEVETDDSGNPTDNKVEMNLVFEIIGIFNPLNLPKKENSENQTQNFGMEQSYEEMEKQNRIYSTNKAITKNSIAFMKEAIKKLPDRYTYVDENGNEVKVEIPEDENEQSYESVFVLKTPEDVEAFKQEAQPLLPKYYKILASSDQYDSIAGPVKSMSKMSKYVLIIALGATLLIITLVVLLFLRDRKHELGVYLSLGEKRSKVIGQIVIEVVMIAFVAITLSVFTGNLLAKGVSDSLMQTQLQQEQDETNMMGINQDEYYFQQLNGNSITSDEVIKAYEVSLSAQYVIAFYLIGLGVVLLSTVVPLIYILRLNPKKIMM